jgi:hypothetical protein
MNFFEWEKNKGKFSEANLLNDLCRNPCLGIYYIFNISQFCMLFAYGF